MSNQIYGGRYPNQNWQSPPQAQPTQQQFQQPVQQVQNIGYIPVPNEEVSRNYPVAPGNSLAFIREDRQYVYIKSMGFSQYDKPIFEKYELVKENESVIEEQVVARDYGTEIDNLNRMLSDIQEELSSLKEQRRRQSNRRRKDTEEE